MASRAGPDEQLAVVKENIPAIRLEAGERPLMICPEVLAFSPDGVAFEGWFLEDLIPLIIESASMV